MGGSNTTTSTQSTTPANATVTSTINKLLGSGGGVQGLFDAGPKVFDQSLYAGVGPTTQGAWNSSIAAANNPAYANGVNAGLGATNGLINSGGLTSGQQGNIGTTSSIGNLFGSLAAGATNPSLTESTMMDTALGKNLGQLDPGYAALRAKLGNDVLGSVNSGFNNSGLFGSDSNQRAATDELTGALAPLDLQQYNQSLDRQSQALQSIEQQRQLGIGNQSGDLINQLGAAGAGFGMGQQGIANQQSAIAALPGLFSALQAPSATAGAVGAAQDADSQAKLSGQADLFGRTNNAQLSLLQQLAGVLGGSAPSAGDDDHKHYSNNALVGKRTWDWGGITMKCSIDGCDNTSRRRGMCEGHYTHWRRGQVPHDLRCARTETKVGAHLQWLIDRRDFGDDDCLTWPFGRNRDGRGQVAVNNRSRQAHRVMCELANGPAPSRRHEAAHSCGNGHLGCVNPRHLRWATHAENLADQIEHDTRSWGERHVLHKLTERAVREIRALHGMETNAVLAARFGVANGTIAKVALRQRWKHI